MNTFNTLPKEDTRILVYWLDKVDRIENVQSGYIENNNAQYVVIQLDNGQTTAITDNLRWKYL